MRNAFARALYEEAVANPDIFLVVADISPAGPMSQFTSEFPHRFVNVGVAEQCMVGIAAGLALKGYRPFTYTIATFALYRPFEMIRDDLCYQSLPVTVVGIGGGVVYSTLGATHYAQEDVAVMSAIPNMQIIAPCDPVECVEATRWTARQSRGPVYLRLGKAGEPTLGDEAAPWEFGKIRFLRRGIDVVVLTYGVIAKMALSIADRLSASGRSASVVSVHTLKPLDRTGIVDAIRLHGHVVVLEEHSPFGGLGAQVKQIAWDIGASAKLDAFTLQDRFVHSYGSHDVLLAAHGLSEEDVLRRVLSTAATRG